MLGQYGLMWTLLGAQWSLARHPSPLMPRLEGACKPGCWQLGKPAREGLVPEVTAMLSLETLPEGEGGSWCWSRTDWSLLRSWGTQPSFLLNKDNHTYPQGGSDEIRGGENTSKVNLFILNTENPHMTTFFK